MVANISTKERAEEGTIGRLLNDQARSPLVEEFEESLRARICGQERALRAISALYEVYRSGMSNPTRPIGTMLFLGPTGSGKTRIVEAAAESLFDNAKAVVKINCAEYQHSHEIAKLIGSPPGYLGHRETAPKLTQVALSQYHTKLDPFTILLFDEIEKASDAFWKLLLGVLDKGTLTLGDNSNVDFSQTMVFMTSNLGAKQMGDLITGSMGFAPARKKQQEEEEDIDQKLYSTALEAARRHFSPEFMNRIDKVIVFRTLKRADIERILDLELGDVYRRIAQQSGVNFVFRLTNKAKELLLTEGVDPQYGARHLKRSIERFLVHPLARMSSSGEIRNNDSIVVHAEPGGKKLVFYAEEPTEMLVMHAGQSAEDCNRMIA